MPTLHTPPPTAVKNEGVTDDISRLPLAARRPSDRRPDRRRHLDRIRYPTSATAGCLDEEPRGREDRDAAVLRVRSEVRKQSWRNRVEGNFFSAEPNDGHRALARLEQQTALHTLITQNVDRLHHDAGSSPERIIEIHGNVREVKCLTCGWARTDGGRARPRPPGEDDPACPDCGGILKSATISFGENLVTEDLERSQAAAEAPTSSWRSARRSRCIRPPPSRDCPAARRSAGRAECAADALRRPGRRRQPRPPRNVLPALVANI